MNNTGSPVASIHDARLSASPPRQPHYQNARKAVVTGNDDLSDDSEFSLLGAVSSGSLSVTSLTSMSDIAVPTAIHSPLDGSSRDADGSTGQANLPTESLSPNTASIIGLLSRATSRRTRTSIDIPPTQPTGLALPTSPTTSHHLSEPQELAALVNSLSDVSLKEAPRSSLSKSPTEGPTWRDLAYPNPIPCWHNHSSLSLNAPQGYEEQASTASPPAPSSPGLEYDGPAIAPQHVPVDGSLMSPSGGVQMIDPVLSVSEEVDAFNASMVSDGETIIARGEPSPQPIIDQPPARYSPQPAPPIQSWIQALHRSRMSPVAGYRQMASEQRQSHPAEATIEANSTLYVDNYPLIKTPQFRPQPVSAVATGSNPPVDESILVDDQEAKAVVKEKGKAVKKVSFESFNQQIKPRSKAGGLLAPRPTTMAPPLMRRTSMPRLSVTCETESEGSESFATSLETHSPVHQEISTSFHPGPSMASVSSQRDSAFGARHPACPAERELIRAGLLAPSGMMASRSDPDSVDVRRCTSPDPSLSPSHCSCLTLATHATGHGQSYREREWAAMTPSSPSLVSPSQSPAISPPQVQPCQVGVSSWPPKVKPSPLSRFILPPRPHLSSAPTPVTRSLSNEYGIRSTPAEEDRSKYYADLRARFSMRQPAPTRPVEQTTSVESNRAGTQLAFDVNEEDPISSPQRDPATLYPACGPPRTNSSHPSEGEEYSMEATVPMEYPMPTMVAQPIQPTAVTTERWNGQNWVSVETEAMAGRLHPASFTPHTPAHYPVGSQWQSRPPTTGPRGYYDGHFQQPAPTAPLLGPLSLPMGTFSLPAMTMNLPHAQYTPGYYPLPPITPGPVAYQGAMNQPSSLNTAFAQASSHYPVPHRPTTTAAWLKGTPSTIPHPRYTFADATVVFIVEQKEYRVHRHFFEQHSEQFKGTLQPGARGLEPIMLTNITSTDFERVLSIFYPLNLAQPTELTTMDEWLSVLSFSTQYLFKQLRIRAIKELEKVTTAVERIVISRAYDIPEWELPAYRELCTRGRPVSIEEGNELGMETVIQIWEVETELKLRTHLCSGPCCTRYVDGIVKSKFGIP